MSAFPMTVEEVQAFLDGAFPDAPPPYVVEVVTGDRIRMRQTIGPHDSRPGGTVSGPSLMALSYYLGIHRPAQAT